MCCATKPLSKSARAFCTCVGAILCCVSCSPAGDSQPCPLSVLVLGAWWVLKLPQAICASVSAQVFPTLPPISTTSTSCPSAAAVGFMLWCEDSSS